MIFSTIKTFILLIIGYGEPTHHVRRNAGLFLALFTGSFIGTKQAANDL